MSNDLNLCQFIGRLGQDPETRFLPSGTQIATISIAVGSQWKDKESGDKKESTEWVRVTAFGKLAEIFEKYLHKGKQVYISGRFRTQKWQDKQGNDRYSTDIVADTMQMLGSKQDGNPRSDDGRSYAEASGRGSKARPPADDFDDDIPFAFILPTLLSLIYAADQAASFVGGII